MMDVSAKIIIPFLIELVHPKRALDVGCGAGAWALEFLNHGVDAVGIDHFVDKKQVLLDKAQYRDIDLTSSFDLGHFDIAVCMEVAEHIHDMYSRHLVDLLCKHSDVVLFSAAIPYQGGFHHINEQPPEYWKWRFQNNEYVCLDNIRAACWYNDNINPYYRNNMYLYVREDRLKDYPMLDEYYKSGNHSPGGVHPALFAHIASGEGVLLKDFVRMKLSKAIRGE